MTTDRHITAIIMRGYEICTMLAIIGCIAFITMLVSSELMVVRISMWIGVYSLLGMGYILLGMFLMVLALVLVSMVPW